MGSRPQQAKESGVLVVHQTHVDELEEPKLLDACKTGSYELVCLVLRCIEKGSVDLNETDEIGHAPLETAITAGYTRIALLLIEHGADVTYSRRYDGSTPLHSALIRERYDIVKLLMSRDSCYPTMNQAAHNGFTPLHVASSNGNAEIVYILLQSGASVEARDARGWTPLFLASWRGHVSVIAHLVVSGGANVNARDVDGQTPLSLAYQKGNEEAVLALLEYGAQQPVGNFGDGLHLGGGVKKTFGRALKSMLKAHFPSFPASAARRARRVEEKDDDCLSETVCSSVPETL